MKRVISFIIIASLLCVAGCGSEASQVVTPLRPVKTIVIGKQKLGKMWAFSGTAEDALESDLSFRVSGKIISFPGDQIGRRFTEGQIIARLDPSDYELEFRQARANMQQVKANFVRSKADVERNRQLFDRKVISRSEMDQAEAEFKSYEAQLSASAKKLDISQKRLGYTTLRAPFDGWIGSVAVNKHQNVQSGQAVVGFNAGRQMKMYVSVPDTLIAQVREGDEVAVRFDALPHRKMTGKVMEIGVGSSEGSSYPVKVYLDNKDKAIRSGMTGHVNFLGHSNGEQSVLLPMAAVLGGADGSRSVWIVDPATTTVHNRPVSLGDVTAYGIEIVSGLKPGEIVVTRGVHKLKEGLKVRLMQNGSEG